MRSVVGVKLGEYLTAKSITKSEICINARISRPTLNKLSLQIQRKRQS
jgi:DNA-binding CsgD family transcriptional regulator